MSSCAAFNNFTMCCCASLLHCVIITNNFSPAVILWHLEQGRRTKSVQVFCRKRCTKVCIFHACNNFSLRLLSMVYCLTAQQPSPCSSSHTSSPVVNPCEAVQHKVPPPWFSLQQPQHGVVQSNQDGQYLKSLTEHSSRLHFKLFTRIEELKERGSEWIRLVNNSIRCTYWIVCTCTSDYLAHGFMCCIRLHHLVNVISCSSPHKEGNTHN